MSGLQSAFTYGVARPSRFGNPISLLAAVAVVALGATASGVLGKQAPMFVAIGIAIYTIMTLQIANAWERVVVLRLGHFRGIRGPGVFWIVPFVDRMSVWVDTRIQTSSFTAEVTLTKDTVPVNVDAVLFWVIWDAQKAALEVASFQDAIGWASQTALRDTIGATNLGELLSNRRAIDERLQATIDSRTTPWGITVQSVEIRDIQIPPALQDAMSREAQAEREKHARVILGDAERQIAASFLAAAETYGSNATALHLRAMNILYEGLKEKSTMIVVPSTAVETMGLGAISGLTSLAAKRGVGPEADPGGSIHGESETS